MWRPKWPGEIVLVLLMRTAGGREGKVRGWEEGRNGGGGGGGRNERGRYKRGRSEEVCKGKRVRERQVSCERK